MPLNKNGFLGDEINNWKENNINKYKDFFDLAHQLNQFVYMMFSEIPIERGNTQKIVVWLLFLRISEIFQGIIILLKNGMVSEGRILLRSLLEALFKLVSCIKNKENVEKYITEWEKIKEGQYNKLLKHPEYLDNELKIIGEELKNRNKNLNIPKERRIEDIAREAGLSEFFNLIYPILSSSTHSDIKELENEHLEIDDQNTIQNMKIEPHDRNLSLVLHTSIKCVLIMLENLNSLIELKIDQDIQTFDASLETFWAKQKEIKANN